MKMKIIKTKIKIKIKDEDKGTRMDEEEYSEGRMRVRREIMAGKVKQ